MRIIATAQQIKVIFKKSKIEEYNSFLFQTACR
jgi:hypothetical protein